MWKFIIRTQESFHKKTRHILYKSSRLFWHDKSQGWTWWLQGSGQARYGLSTLDQCNIQTLAGIQLRSWCYQPRTVQQLGGLLYKGSWVEVSQTVYQYKNPLQDCQTTSDISCPPKTGNLQFYEALLSFLFLLPPPWVTKFSIP